MHARATHGEGTLNLPLDSDWAGNDANINDPVEVELAGRLALTCSGPRSRVRGTRDV
jgi:hypothetical protein